MFGAYSVRLEQVFDDYYNRLARLGLTEEVLPLLSEEGSLFSFSRVPEVKSQLDNIFDDFVTKQMGVYRAGITDGAILAIEHDSALLEGYSVLGETALKTVRNNAVSGFLRGRLKSSRGLSLSQLVWNYASQAKSEFEVAISNVITQGLQEGTSAEELGRKVREQLNNPDMMYRRYHEKIIGPDGIKRDVAIWRRRVIDEDGKVRFVKEPLEKVGMGHYRSARKNALRLMRTEINASYHNANFERWQQEPFVIGIRIFLSPQHPEPDCCDELAGNYPKDFYWTGWHPQCMCASAPITLQGQEKKDYYRRVALGEDMSGYVSPNAITDVPQGYKDYVAANAEKIRRADERGTLAWHFQDNREYWEDIVDKELKPISGIGDVLRKLFASTENAPDPVELTPEQRKEVDTFISMLRRKGRYYDHDMLDALNEESYRIIELIKGIKRGAPMSFKDADSGRANKYGGGDNCAIAVLAHELRIRGFDLTALPLKETPLREDNSKAWFMPSNGTNPYGKRVNLREEGAYHQMAKDIVNEMSKPGRYHVHYNALGQDGHIICVDRLENGQIRAYDPQRNKKLSIKRELSTLVSNKAIIYRVDNMIINPEYLNLLAPF